MERTRALMCSAVRDSLVVGYEQLIDSLDLPGKDDRHVLAAAIRSGAQVIVTYNLKDFPAAALDPFGIEAQSPDDFVLHRAPPHRFGAQCRRRDGRASGRRVDPPTTDRLGSARNLVEQRARSVGGRDPSVALLNLGNHCPQSLGCENRTHSRGGSRWRFPKHDL